MSELPPQIVHGQPVTGQDERALLNAPLGEGVDGYNDLLVTPAGSGLHVEVAAGVGYVRGDSIPDQGLYRIRNDALVSSADFAGGSLEPAHASHPRLDQIIARVYDHEADASGSRTWRLEVLTGTPTSGADLDNRDGAAALPDSAMLLADVLVPASASGLSSSDIRDRRPFARLACPLGVGADLVPFVPVGFAPTRGCRFGLGGPGQHAQAACLFALPRRIEGVTKVHWAYTQDGDVPMKGKYRLGIYDASGRKIVVTDELSFTGAAESSQKRSEDIGPITLDGGLYYVWVGLSSGDGEGGLAYCHGCAGLADDSGQPHTAPAPGTFFGWIGFDGGTDAPDTLDGFWDRIEAPAVPLIALSNASS